jgi:rSAM/selenodomain-associated transferase 2
MFAAIPRLSIIVPVLNEAELIEPALQALAPYRQRGAEVIVVDGGSNDGTPERALPLADRVIVAPRGRALQMNAGASRAIGQIFLFLHADTRLPHDADRLIAQGLARHRRPWGRFDVRIDGGAALALVATLMNWRSPITGIATGDHALFMTRNAFAAVIGFPEIALMEDIAICAKLKRFGRPLCLSAQVTTSGRRWRTYGVAQTVLLVWRLRLGYFFGADPATLARRYGYAPADNSTVTRPRREYG